MENLIIELLKKDDNLQDVKFTFNDTNYIWYFKYLTLLEKARIDEMSAKLQVTIDKNGNKTEEYKKQEYMIPIHTIIEKALDVEGKRLFSHTNPDHIEAIGNMPAGMASMIAYQMSLDIFGTLDMNKDDDAE